MLEEKISLNETLQPIENIPEFLQDLLDRGKTYANLSVRGLQAKVEGSSCQVYHNKVNNKALLRIPQEESRLRLMFIDKAYRGRSEHKLPKVASNPSLVFDACGDFDKDENTLTFDFSDKTADEVAKAINLITKFCDASHKIKTFVIRYPEIMTLLGHAMLDESFEAVSVNPKGDLVINNLAKKYQTDKEDRSRDPSIFATVANELGLKDQGNSFDIQLYFEDPVLRKYIKDLQEITQNDANHPMFLEILDIFTKVLLQVKEVRESLVYLVPINSEEIVKVVFEGKKRLKYSASFIDKKGIRKNRHYCGNEVNKNTGTILFPSNERFDFSPQKGVSLLRKDLLAELRHHIHYVFINSNSKQREVLASSMPIFTAITEMVDDFRFFHEHVSGDIYYEQYISSDEKLLLRILGEEPDLNAIDNRLLPWKKARWAYLSLLDSKIPKSMDGHDLIEYSFHKLGVMVRKAYQFLTPEEIQLIDQTMFRYLTSLDLDTFCNQKNELLKTAALAKTTEKKQDLEKFYSLLPHNISGTRETLDGVVQVGQETEELFKKVEHLENHKMSREEYKSLSQDVSDLSQKISNSLLKYIPFSTSDGKDYPTQMAHVFDPQVLFEVIKKALPEWRIWGEG